MTFDPVRNFVELDEMQKRNAALEREIDKIRLKYIALERLNSRGHYIPIGFDPFDLNLPQETRGLITREMAAIQDEERKAAVQKEKDERRWAEHLEWEAKREAKEQAEQVRISENLRIHGSARPESLAQFSSLPVEMKSRLIGLFGPTFLEELGRKPSGVSWALWDSLKAATGQSKETPEVVPAVPPPPPTLPESTDIASATPRRITRSIPRRWCHSFTTDSRYLL